MRTEDTAISLLPTKHCCDFLKTWCTSRCVSFIFKKFFWEKGGLKCH